MARALWKGHVTFGLVNIPVELHPAVEDNTPRFRMLHKTDLSPISMRNKFSPYGSNYDDTSACNAAATHPPLIVTSDGKSLGLLTVNTSLKKRIDTPSVTDWLARMCGE